MYSKANCFSRWLVGCQILSTCYGVCFGSDDVKLLNIWIFLSAVGVININQQYLSAYRESFCGKTTFNITGEITRCNLNENEALQFKKVDFTVLLRVSLTFFLKIFVWTSPSMLNDFLCNLLLSFYCTWECF